MCCFFFNSFEGKFGFYYLAVCYLNSPSLKENKTKQKKKYEESLQDI